jgi:hypothetical protein
MIGSKLFIPPKDLFKPSHIAFKNPNTPISPLSSKLLFIQFIIKFKI